jgi:hypothetical protein
MKLPKVYLREFHKRKAKIPIPAARKRDFRYAPTSWLRGIPEFLPQPTGLWYRTFALKRILYFI